LYNEPVINKPRGLDRHLRRTGAVALWCVVPAITLVSATEAWAQGVIAPPPAAYQTPSTLSPLTSPFFSPAPGAPPAAVGLVETVGQTLILDFHPSLLYRLIYSDGTPTSPGVHVNTVIQEFSPGLRLNIGDHWALSYGADVNIYSSKQFANETDQNFSLNGHTTYQDWGFNFALGYSTSDSILQETQTQTEQQGYNTSFSASHQMTSHLSSQFSVSQSISSSSAGGVTQDVDAWNGSAGLNYQFWSRFGIGITGSGGINLVSPGANTAFEQGQVSLNYHPATKLSLSLSGGMEVSQLMGAQLVNPTFSGSINYSPVPQTTFSVGATRTVSPALYQDLVTVNTAFNVGVSQRLLEKLTLTANAAYSTTPYIGFALLDNANAFNLNGAPIATSSSVTRQDDSTSLIVRLSLALLKRGSLSIFYSVSDTTSSISDFDLSTTQVGIELGYHY
jgi:Putative beta-barrel porin 2